MKLYDELLVRLKQEMVPALGCTEPIAIALASAKASEVMGGKSQNVVIKVSGNILKNVKSVKVPNTKGMKGVDAACIIGLIAGKSKYGLEVLKDVTDDDINNAKKLLDSGFCKVERLITDDPLHIIVEAYGENRVSVELKGGHEDIIKIIKNDEIIFEKDEQEKGDFENFNCKLLDIYEFSKNVKLKDVESLMKTAIKDNSAIAYEGLKHNWGQNVGATLLKTYGNDVNIRARALAAAGSDARMSGCSMPVIINSGSGNQGITITMPIVVFSEELKVSEEKEIRALVLANLVAIYIKKDMGPLSAFCGTVTAACGAGAGIAYLYDMTFDQIVMTIKNTLGNVSGLVCDGAKASCAAKISSSIDACILAVNMAKDNLCFPAGDGIVCKDIDTTIKGIVEIGKNAMQETDEAVLNIMLNN